MEFLMDVIAKDAELVDEDVPQDLPELEKLDVGEQEETVQNTFSD